MNKKRKICPEIFVLNMNSMHEYKFYDPDELIIIYTSYNYSSTFYQSIIDGGIKKNVKKIITSDAIMTKYIKYIEKNFSLLFPNCMNIKINSFDNDFMLIFGIIDDLKIIKYVEYELNDHVFSNNSIMKYVHFINSIILYNLSNIKYIKIINNIKKITDCTIETKILANLLNFNLLKNKNNNQNDVIKKYGIVDENINFIYLEYIHNKKITQNIIININDFYLI